MMEALRETVSNRRITSPAAKKRGRSAAYRSQLSAAFEQFSRKWRRDEVPLFPVLGAFAAFYFALVLIFSPGQLQNDEFRYFSSANNLTKGFFVPAENPDFTNGPGYPMLLTPVMSLLGFEFGELVMDADDYEYYLPDTEGNPDKSDLKWRLLPLRLLNVLFLSAGLFVIFRAARLFVSNRAALIIVLAVGLNPFQLRWVPFMMTENVTPLIFGGFAWAYVMALRSNRFSWKLAALAGALFGYFMLTRTIFGYVAVTALVAIPLICLLNGKRRLAWQAVSPIFIALILCLPYLAYTHHHTGRVFCWATNDGELLYWITSPHEEEFGNWQQEKWIINDPVLSKNHLAFIQKVNSLPPLDRKVAWMEGIRKNLQSDGIVLALARNYLANVSRAFFGSPSTKQYQNFPKLVWTLTGVCFLIPAVLALYPTLRCWRRVSIEIKLLMLITLIYFGGALLLPTGPRYWIPVLPVVFVWIAYSLEKFVSVRIRIRLGDTPSP